MLHSVLDAESLPINQPVTVVNGWTIRNASLRYRDEKHTHEWHSSLLRIPMRVHRDYFIHKDVWPGVPEFVPRMPGLHRFGPEPGARPAARRDRYGYPGAVGRDGHPSARHSSVPKYQELLRQIFDVAGRRARLPRIGRGGVPGAVRADHRVVWCPTRPRTTEKQELSNTETGGPLGTAVCDGVVRRLVAASVVVGDPGAEIGGAAGIVGVLIAGGSHGVERGDPRGEVCGAQDAVVVGICEAGGGCFGHGDGVRADGAVVRDRAVGPRFVRAIDDDGVAAGESRVGLAGEPVPSGLTSSMSRKGVSGRE